MTFKAIVRINSTRDRLEGNDEATKVNDEAIQGNQINFEEEEEESQKPKTRRKPHGTYSEEQSLPGCRF